METRGQGLRSGHLSGVRGLAGQDRVVVNKARPCPACRLPAGVLQSRAKSGTTYLVFPVALLGDGSCQHHPGTQVSSSEPVAEDGHQRVFPEGVLEGAESLFPSAQTVKGAFFLTVVLSYNLVSPASCRTWQRSFWMESFL